MSRAARLAAILAALASLPACRRSRHVEGGRDAGAAGLAVPDDVLCWQRSDGCVFCYGRDGQAPFIEAEHSRPWVCDPRDPDNCVEFCSPLAPGCALPWEKGPGCVFDSELAFRRAVFEREAADRPEAAFHGRVVDEGGRRVDGARVGVWVTWRDQVTHLADEVSGRDGQFRVRLRAGPWTYALRIRYPGLASELVDRLAPDRPQERGQGARLFRLGPEQLVRGRVVDATGAPVDGARVQALRSAEDAIGASEATTADDGSFSLGGLGPRRYFLRVSKFGWRATTTKAPVTAPAGRVAIKLARANAIRGVVRNADGAAEPNALVAAVLSGSMPGVSGVPYVWMADAEGRFAYDQFLPGTYYVWARRGDMLLYPPERIELAANQEAEVELTLRHRGARVAGQVRGRDGFRLGRDSRAVLLSRSPLSFPRSPIGELDADGRFVIAGVLPGRYEITVRDGARTLVVVDGPRDIEVPIEPDSAVTLPGPVEVRPQASE